MKTKLWYILILGAFVMLFIEGVTSGAVAAEQSVTLSPALVEKEAGGSVTLSAFYEVSDGNNMLSGLGLRFHFDSAKLHFAGYGDMFSTGLISTGDEPREDVLDLDENPETDKYVSVGWVSFTNPPNWPGAALPLELAQLHFLVREEAPDGVTPVNVSFSRNAGGYTTGSTGCVIQIAATFPGAITGVVTYTGIAEGTIRVGAYRDQNLENLIAQTEKEESGPFTIEALPPGTYYVAAFLDLEGSDTFEGKPQGRAPSPVTLVSGETGDAGTIMLYHVAARIILEADPWRLSSVTPSETALTATIVDEWDYTVNAGPDSMLEVTFSIAEETYGEIKAGEVNPVTAMDGAATITVVSRVHDTGGAIHCAARAEGVQGQGELSEGSVTITTVPFSIVPPGPVVLLVSETKEFNVTGGTPPYMWSVTQGSLSNSVTQTADQRVVFAAPESETTNIIITVTEETGIQSQAVIDVYEPVEVVDKPTTPPRVESGNSSDIFTVSGGDGSYTWAARDSSGAVIDTHEGSVYSFFAPADGTAFAGPYAITVNDGNGLEDSFDVYVPLQFMPQSKNIKGGGTFDLVLAGAEQDAVISLIQFLNEKLETVPPDEMSRYATFLPSVPVDFDSEALLSFTAAQVSALKMFRLTATVAGDPDLTEANGLNTVTTGWIRVLPVITYAGVVRETNEEPVAGARLIFKLEGVIQGGPIQTGADGSFSTQDLMLLSPVVTGAEYDVEVLADNLVSRTDLTTEGWDLEDGEVITLVEADLSVTGTVGSTLSTPIEGALLEGAANSHLFVAYTDAQGSYTINLPQMPSGDEVWYFQTTNNWAQGCQPEEDDEGTAIITQTGNDVTVLVEDGPTYTGTVEGSTYTVSASYEDEGGTVEETATFTLTSATEGSGTLAWSWTGDELSCNGGSSLYLTKQDGKTITEFFARASAPGFGGATQDILVDPDFLLPPIAPGDEAGSEGGILTSGDCTVNIPEGALDGPAIIELDCAIPVGPESVYTRHSVALAEITIIGANINEGTPLLVTIPFDTAHVDPGDFRTGTARINFADSADDLRNGEGVMSVPAEDMALEDHVKGLASFRVRHASVFGAGASEAGPTVTTGAATTVGRRIATLNGLVNPNGTSTTYHFEYGTDTRYGLSTEEMEAGSGTTDLFVSVDLTALLQGTVYHFRLVATNSNGTARGEDQTFSTKDESDDSICFIQTAGLEGFF
jgi:hypothetical protein